MYPFTDCTSLYISNGAIATDEVSNDISNAKMTQKFVDERLSGEKSLFDPIKK